MRLEPRDMRLVPRYLRSKGDPCTPIFFQLAQCIRTSEDQNACRKFEAQFRRCKTQHVRCGRRPRRAPAAAFGP